MMRVRTPAGTSRPATLEEVRRAAVSHAIACETGCTYEAPPRHHIRFGLTCLVGQGLFRSLQELPLFAPHRSAP